jgi:glycosyltransferase involved in cell wall biosynthesis
VSKRPLVSVLLPVRDEAAFLPAALASLSEQTFTDFEVVVVDDGSGDGTGAIAERHARSDSRFRLLRQPPTGIVAALERARATARGRFLARMDGDDVAFPERLERQLDALEDESLTMCGGRIECFPAHAVTDGRRRYEAWINGLVTVDAAVRDVLVECPLPHPTLVVRREAVDAVGGYRDVGWPEDYDLVLRLWARGARFRNVDSPVLRWRDHPRRLSRVSAAYGLPAFVRCKVHHLRAARLAGWDGVVVWGAGPVGKAFARELQRQGERVVAFVDVDPRKIGHAVYGAPVLPVDQAAALGRAFAVGAVAGREPRARIRVLVAAQGRRDGVDFLAVA